MRRLFRRLLLAAPALVLAAGCGDSSQNEIPKDLSKPVPKLNAASGGGAPAKKGGPTNALN